MKRHLHNWRGPKLVGGCRAGIFCGDDQRRRLRRLLTSTVAGIDVTKDTSQLAYGDGTEGVGINILQANLNGLGADDRPQVNLSE